MTAPRNRTTVRLSDGYPLLNPAIDEAIDLVATAATFGVFCGL